MSKFQHGGNIYKYADDVIDFSANINPLGMPKEAKNAIIDNITKYEVYPDHENRELLKDIGKFHGVKEENIVCGNGAADLIFRIVLSLKPEKAMVTAPTFSEYEEALKLTGTEINYHYLKEADNFILKEDILNSIDNDYNLIFLCSPNNPTGIPVDKALMIKILDLTARNNQIVVVDQCFAPFLEEEYKYSLVDLLIKYPNLIILEAFTKIFAMAGLRLGYALIGDHIIRERIKNTLQPWSVSTVALKAGIGALKEEGFINKTKKFVSREREFLKSELKELGFKVYPSLANYILFKASPNLGRSLEDKNILIRYCENYEGLDNTYYRIAVKNRDDNTKLINAIKEIKRGL